MADELQDVIEKFQLADADMRFELLLDYAKRLPPIPPELHELRDSGMHSVPECMTPVFLKIDLDGDRVRMFVEVAEEAPTAKGFISILYHTCEGAPPRAVAELPPDLLNRLGLSELIRMNRSVGLNAILGRIKRAAGELVGES